MNEKGKSLYADALFMVVAAKDVIATAVPADQIDHQAAVGQIGATIVHIAMHPHARWAGSHVESNVYRFVEHLINQLFVQGLRPSDLFWSGPIPHRDEFTVVDLIVTDVFAAVDLIAADVWRAITEDDVPKMKRWFAVGFRKAGNSTLIDDFEELERADQWRDVFEYTKRVLASLFQQSRSRSLRRSGRRIP